MAKLKAVVLTKAQRDIVNHFAGYIKDQAALARYAALVEAALRAIPEGFNSLNVTAACLRASAQCYPEWRKRHVVAIDRRS